jgi:ketosteroid isomerase-like protein
MQRIEIQVEGDLAWVAVPWTSQGRTRDGQRFDRHGRATYVLRRRDNDGRWVAVHSHHSLNPA